MNSITSILLCTVFCLVIACKNKAPQPITPTAETDSTTGSYLPVAEFIKSDIKRVDSFAGGIMKKVNMNGRKDSLYIQVPQFHQLASQFLLPELDSVSFHQQFSESSLMDETTQLLNFIYTPKDGSTQPGSLQKVIVYIKPSLANDKVNRIYMERSFSSGDTLVQQKLNWKMEGYFYILTIRQPKAGPAVTSMEKVIWDPQQFAD
jgi:hypothetical protein